MSYELLTQSMQGEHAVVHVLPTGRQEPTVRFSVCARTAFK